MGCFLKSFVGSCSCNWEVAVALVDNERNKSGGVL